MSRKIVYVSGAYSSPDLSQKFHNTLQAWQAAQRIWRAGHIAICPHANTFLMGESPNDKIDFVAGDLVIIERCCDALYMLSSWKDSPGACMEWKYAIAEDIPIFYECSWDEMMSFLEEEDRAK